MLLRKMLRDIKSNRTQFVSIFLMSILGVLIYAGINAEWYGMKTEINDYYEETHLPNIWVMSNQFSEMDAANVEQIKGVSRVALRSTFDANMDSVSRPTLRINVVDENTLSMPKIIDGEAFDTTRDGLWLDATFAEANHLKVGDQIGFEIMGSLFKKTVLGTIIHPEYVHNVKDESSLIPNPETFGFAFIPQAAFPVQMPIPNNHLLIAIDSGVDKDLLLSELEDLFSDRYNMIIDRDQQPSVAMFQSEIEQSKAMGSVFPVVFFLIAALTMLTTMTRMTSNQRIQIGTLKALGFSRRKILTHYVSYGVWIGLAGGLIGLLLGPLIIPPILFTMQKTIYTLPNWSVAISPSAIVAVALAVFSCTASSYFACRKQLKEVPASTLRPRVPKAGRHTWIERSKLWRQFGFSTQWNLRDVLRSRIRSIMAIVGVLGCSALMLFGLGLRDTVNEVSTWMYRDLNVYESRINLEEGVAPEVIETLIENYSGQLIQEEGIEVQYKDQNQSGSLTVLGEGKELLFEDKKGKSLSFGKEEVGLSYKMAQFLKVEVGDTIEWRIFGEKAWQKSVVHIIFRTPMGQGIAMRSDAYIKMGRSFQPNVLLSSKPAIHVEQFAGVQNVKDKDQLIDNFDRMLESIKMIVAILVLAAAILGSVVLYNLGALSFTERTRELATLKVLGFFPKQIRALLQMQTIWLTVIGIILGLPAGYALVKFMLSTMPNSTDMRVDISWTSLLITVIGTFILSIVVNLFLSRKVKSIDMVSSLKSVE